ncbi:MAG: Zn-ribbon domain-containing OB-fold protein [Thermoplasmatota archaeon]
MTFLEKQTDPTSPMHWRGDMQADYLYPNGHAGDKFFKNLKEKGTFMATKCPKCSKVLFPARLYCEDCFVEIPDENWIEVPPTGIIRLYTFAKLDAHWEPLETPRCMALIDVDGTDGAILGVVNVPETDDDLSGATVKAKLVPKAKREGTMKDIIYFEIY